MVEILQSMSALAWVCVGAILWPLLYVALFWRVFSNWAKADGRGLFILGAGFAFGGIIVAMLFFVLSDRKLPDSVLTIFGSFGGIAAALGGGLWLWQMQDAKATQRLRAAIRNSCDHLAPDIIDLYSDCIGFFKMVDTFSARGLSLIAKAAAIRIDKFGYRVRRYQSSLINLDDDDQNAHAETERQLEILASQIRKFRQLQRTKANILELQSRAGGIAATIENLGKKMEPLSPYLLEQVLKVKRDNGFDDAHNEGDEDDLALDEIESVSD